MNDMTPYLWPSVLATFPAFTEQFEGRVRWMYVDVRGLITTGVGNLIDPILLAVHLPWQVGARRADLPEIARSWKALKSISSSLASKGYRACESMNELRLTDAVIDRMVLAKLLDNAAIFRTHFPELGSWPEPIQMATMSMCWALGPAFGPKWPRLSSALEAKDWERAAEECGISEINNGGVHPRNVANKALFLEAASAIA